MSYYYYYYISPEGCGQCMENANSTLWKVVVARRLREKDASLTCSGWIREISETQIYTGVCFNPSLYFMKHHTVFSPISIW